MPTSRKIDKVGEEIDNCMADLSAKQEELNEILYWLSNIDETTLEHMNNSGRESKGKRGKSRGKSAKEQIESYEERRDKLERNIGRLWRKISELQERQQQLEAEQAYNYQYQ